MQGLTDFSSRVMATEMYSIEFITHGLFLCMSVWFWKCDSLVRVELHWHHQSDSHPGCYLTAISCLLSFLSSKPNLVSISGCSSMIFRALETRGLFNLGIQYPFRFEVFSSLNGCTQEFADRIRLRSDWQLLATHVLSCLPSRRSQPTVSITVSWALPGYLPSDYAFCLFLFRLCIPFWPSTLSFNFWLHP